MKYLIGIFLVFLSSAFAQDCQSTVIDMTGKEEQKSVIRYTYNAAEMKCVLYFEGDPNVKANSFVTKKACEEQCSWKPDMDCTSPKDSGPCRATHKHFYYNTTTSTCEEFTYGGCQGNANNYRVLNYCVGFCVPKPKDCQSAVKQLSVQDLARMTEEERQTVLIRYTYNATKMKCVPYREVDPNVRANSFKTSEECRGNCSWKPGIDCTSPKDSGPCREAHKHFYYNTASSTCEEFAYGGCQGNSNNYRVLNHCMRFCIPQPDDCQSAVTNMAKKEIQKSVIRYTYNAAEMKCAPYFEGDLKVRANSFFTDNECFGQCSPKNVVDCISPKDSGPCSKPHKRFYYNTASSTCEEFTYGGCQGNSNNYESLDACVYFCLPQPDDCQSAVTNMSKKEGQKGVERYTYNAAEMKCVPYLEGDQNVRANSFLSEMECEAQCKRLRGKDCTSPKDSGPCREAHERFFYNTTSLTCEEFAYGGCEGNGNNYESLLDCEDSCASPLDEECISPKDSGPCPEAHKRFYYNTASSTCEEFAYGGCQGNGNNYGTLQDCEDACVSRPNDCNYPKDPGLCPATHRRYFYNTSSLKCEEFEYGGCEGNVNNFRNLAVCQKSCEK